MIIITIGIYRFENRITGLSYIGQSVQLEERYWQHKRNYTNPKSHSYNSKFYRALRKYGFDNFNYEILYKMDKYDQDELNNQEQYWINYYNSYYNGYNMNPGGNATGSNYFISKEKVLEIKKILKYSPEISFSEIVAHYHLSSVSIVSSINAGKSYRFLGEYEYPIRTKQQCLKQVQGEKITGGLCLQIKKFQK